MNRTEAEEHLRVIRSLMEKATIYRAISAPTALVGGLASVIVGGALFFQWRNVPEGVAHDEAGKWFVFGWLGVLVITAAANGWFILRDARRRGDRFASPGMRKALLALLPAMLCGGIFTGFQFVGTGMGPYWILPELWMIFYGLGLLATAQFAPRSIPILGWVFLISGLGSSAAQRILEAMGQGWNTFPAVANIPMVCTFGLFHLIYAACTWPRGGASGGEI